MRPVVLVSQDSFDASDAASAFHSSLTGETGAVVTFAGIVRGSGDLSLTLQHYPGYTERKIGEIATRAIGRFGLDSLLVRHRVGTMRPGETIVFVAAAGAHRREAFEACDFMMDYLKSAAPFWKQETVNRESRWIEPTARDIADRQRWEVDDARDQ